MEKSNLLPWAGAAACAAAAVAVAIVLRPQSVGTVVDSSLSALRAAVMKRSFRPALLTLPGSPLGTLEGLAVTRVVSYNVLADGDRYALTGQAYCPREYLVADSRYPRVFEELRAYDADICGMQEAQEGPGGFVERLEHEFKATRFPTPPSTPLPPYSTVFSPRADDAWRKRAKDEYENGDKSAWLQFSGDVTLVKHQRLKILATQVVRLSSFLDDVLSEWGFDVEDVWNAEELEALPSSTAPLPSSGVDPMQAVRELAFRVKRRYDSACITLVQDKETGRPLLHVNTHTYYSPFHPDVKAVQALLLAKSIRQFATTHNFVLDGDEEGEGGGGEGVGGGGGKGGASGAVISSSAPVPYVLAGDMNAIAEKEVRDSFDAASEEEFERARERGRGLRSGLVRLLEEGKLGFDDQDHPSRRHYKPPIPTLKLPISPMRSAYVVARGRDPSTTTRTTTFSECLDFIFLSPSIQVLNVLDMPYEHVFSAPKDSPPTPIPDQLNHTSKHIKQPTYEQFHPIPGPAWPSDHIAVGADIAF